MKIICFYEVLENEVKIYSAFTLTWIIVNDFQAEFFSFKVKVDPTSSRLTSIQRYLKTLLNRNEINEEEYKDMRPKNAKPARAHGLPKIHKQFDHLPKFRPIVDTTGKMHYSVGKYLTNLLNPLTVNDFTLKDSFDAADKINQIPKELFNDGFVFVSFDVTSLFTNVPLSKTINIIIDRISIKI